MFLPKIYNLNYENIANHLNWLYKIKDNPFKRYQGHQSEEKVINILGIKETNGTCPLKAPCHSGFETKPQMCLFHSEEL